VLELFGHAARQGNRVHVALITRVVNDGAAIVISVRGGSDYSIVLSGVDEATRARLDVLMEQVKRSAPIALGTLADTAYQTWRTTAAGKAYTGAYQHVLHPTYPDSAAAQGQDRATAMAKMLADWNTALDALHGTVTPDQAVPLVPYGADLSPAELGVIPEADLPVGLPARMRSNEPWASR
jgi:hypothetical protein